MVTRTRVNALGPVANNAEQVGLSVHFGTKMVTQSFSRLSSIDLNSSTESTSELIREFIQNGKLLFLEKLLASLVAHHP